MIMVKTDKARELGKLKRYTDLMNGDLKNALHTAVNLRKEYPDDAAMQSIEYHLNGIEGALERIGDRLKKCTSQQEI